MVEAKVWEKAIEHGLDLKDVAILNFLAKERKLSKDDIREISKRTKLSEKEIRERIKKLKEKKILLKERVSIIDPIKIWDSYYVVFIKASITPPVLGVKTEFPTGWNIDEYMKGLKEVEKEMKRSLIRHAYVMQGTEWDLMLIVSATSQQEYVEFMHKLAKQGWIAKVWSMIPVEYGEKWIFDPVAVPSEKDYIQTIRAVLRGKGRK